MSCSFIHTGRAEAETQHTHFSFLSNRTSKMHFRRKKFLYAFTCQNKMRRFSSHFFPVNAKCRNSLIYHFISWRIVIGNQSKINPTLQSSLPTPLNDVHHVCLPDNNVHNPPFLFPESLHLVSHPPQNDCHGNKLQNSVWKNGDA